MPAKTHQNDKLASRLDKLSLSEPDFWSFRGNARRDHGHGLMQYPAMMVPQMVSALLGEIKSHDKTITSVGDPFVGSGTVLTEATLRGMNFYGRDVNPLAILLCKVKRGPFFPEALEERADEVLAKIKEDRGQRLEVHFDGIEKWFSRKIRISLSRIRRAICNERSLWARRFFWVALADTVRLTSNSRTSTFKLHIRSLQDREERDLDPYLIFGKVLERNLCRYRSLTTTLRAKGFVNRGRYVGDITVDLADSRISKLSPDEIGRKYCDLVITSPPYGDNATTVPYGQYSYLPLQWIDLQDVDVAADSAYLSSTHEIDHRSLGGSKRIDAHTQEQLCSKSASLSRTLTQLRKQPRDRARRVLTFIRDIDKCIPLVHDILRPSGVMVWVLGNRRVGGLSVPLDKILTELLVSQGSSQILQIRRSIPSKRMAVRNNVANTMANETILVLRRA